MPLQTKSRVAASTKILIGFIAAGFGMLAASFLPMAQNNSVVKEKIAVPPIVVGPLVYQNTLNAIEPTVSLRTVSTESLPSVQALHQELGRQSAALGLSNAQTELSWLETREDGLGGEHDMFQQMHAGFPIWGGTVVTHRRNGELRYIHGSLERNKNFLAAATTTFDQEKITAALGATLGTLPETLEWIGVYWIKKTLPSSELAAIVESQDKRFFVTAAGAILRDQSLTKSACVPTTGSAFAPPQTYHYLNGTFSIPICQSKDTEFQLFDTAPLVRQIKTGAKALGEEWKNVSVSTQPTKNWMVKNNTGKDAVMLAAMARAHAYAHLVLEAWDKGFGMTWHGGKKDNPVLQLGIGESETLEQCITGQCTNAKGNISLAVFVDNNGMLLEGKKDFSTMAKIVAHEIGHNILAGYSYNTGESTTPLGDGTNEGLSDLYGHIALWKAGVPDGFNDDFSTHIYYGKYSTAKNRYTDTVNQIIEESKNGSVFLPHWIGEVLKDWATVSIAGTDELGKNLEPLVTGISEETFSTIAVHALKHGYLGLDDTVGHIVSNMINACIDVSETGNDAVSYKDCTEMYKAATFFGIPLDFTITSPDASFHPVESLTVDLELVSASISTQPGGAVHLSVNIKNNGPDPLLNQQLLIYKYPQPENFSGIKINKYNEIPTSAYDVCPIDGPLPVNGIGTCSAPLTEGNFPSGTWQVAIQNLSNPMNYPIVLLNPENDAKLFVALPDFQFGEITQSIPFVAPKDPVCQINPALEVCSTTTIDFTLPLFHSGQFTYQAPTTILYSPDLKTLWEMLDSFELPPGVDKPAMVAPLLEIPAPLKIVYPKQLIGTGNLSIAKAGIDFPYIAFFIDPPNHTIELNEANNLFLFPLQILPDPSTVTDVSHIPATKASPIMVPKEEWIQWVEFVKLKPEPSPREYRYLGEMIQKYVTTVAPAQTVPFPQGEWLEEKNVPLPQDSQHR